MSPGPARSRRVTRRTRPRHSSTGCSARRPRRSCPRARSSTRWSPGCPPIRDCPRSRRSAPRWSTLVSWQTCRGPSRCSRRSARSIETPAHGPNVTSVRATLRPRQRAAVTRRPPWPLLAVAVGVGVLAALPVVYLLVRALGGDEETLGLLFRARTLELVVSTLGLGMGVGIGAVLFGVPLAWLTVRTDLPGRRLWAVL